MDFEEGSGDEEEGSGDEEEVVIPIGTKVKYVIKWLKSSYPYFWHIVYFRFIPIIFEVLREMFKHGIPVINYIKLFLKVER